jgi:transcriptional regulator with XRE-family HTH domain
VDLRVRGIPAIAEPVDALSRILDDNSIMQDDSRQNIHGLIARRVRDLRAQHGMTLEALAARCDVSRSMISLIERGESSPTAVVLEKIATGLGVPLASLFDDPGAPASPLSRRQDRTPWRDPQSGYVRCNISPPSFPSPLQIVEVVLPGGALVAYETGARDVTIDQQVWVQEGAIELAVGQQGYRLEAGDCLAMQLNEPITFRNPGRAAARYIVVLATGQGRGARKPG